MKDEKIKALLTRIESDPSLASEAKAIYTELSDEGAEDTKKEVMARLEGLLEREGDGVTGDEVLKFVFSRPEIESVELSDTELDSVAGGRGGEWKAEFNRKRRETAKKWDAIRNDGS